MIPSIGATLLANGAANTSIGAAIVSIEAALPTIGAVIASISMAFVAFQHIETTDVTTPQTGDT